MMGVTDLRTAEMSTNALCSCISVIKKDLQIKQTVLPPFSNCICCVNVGRPQRLCHISSLALKAAQCQVHKCPPSIIPN